MTGRTGNVALVLDTCPPSWSSREEFHSRLASELRRRGRSCLVLLSGEPDSEFRRRFEERGATVVAFPYQGLSAPYLLRLHRLVREHGVGLAHVRYFGYFSALPWILRACGVPRIVFTDANSGGWRGRWWKTPFVQLRTRVASFPTQRFIAISRFVRKRLVSAGLSPQKIEVIYNGIDPDRYRPDSAGRDALRSELGLSQGEVAISTISVIRPFKHPEVLVRAFAVLCGRGLPVRLLFAGGGPMRPGLEKLAADLGCADRIRWLGHFQEPWRLLQASDIFAFASVGEAFGFAVAEAMACGVPVVAARAGALPEIVEDGRTGFLTEPLDPSACAAKLQVLIEDCALRARMSQASVERARDLFDIDTCVRRTLAVYDSIGLG